MSVERQDGFSFLRHPDGRLFLSVESERLDDCLGYCQRTRIECLHISPYHGFSGDELGFLVECPHGTAVHLQGGAFDTSGLYHLRQLSYLSAVFEWLQELDLTRFSQLVELQADWHPKRLRGVFECQTLKRLWLRKYKPKNSDLGELAALTELESLMLVQSTIRSLTGVESLRRLWEFEIHYKPLN